MTIRVNMMVGFLYEIFVKNFILEIGQTSIATVNKNYILCRYT